MSLRDVKEYYFQVEKQFFEMSQTVKELREEFELGNISKEMVQQAEQMTLPLRQNYERLSYILYLFNKPNRKSKIGKFNKQNEKLLSVFKDLGADESQCDVENAESLKRFKEFVKELKCE